MSLNGLAKLEDDAVRALAWCIGGPGLMGDVHGLRFPAERSHAGALEAAWDWLLELDKNPAPLHARIAAVRSWKVGIYFETLMNWWLDWHPQYDLLANNLQVRDEKRTLGAFDFILRDQAGATEHWEVAVKFYLQRQNSDAWTAWVGPGQRDRLDIKLERMRDHQLPLSARPEAESALASIAVMGPPQQVTIIKGMFFEPWQGTGQRPQGAAPDTPVGQWVTANDFEAFSKTQPTCRWCIREKPDWLGPARRTVTESFSTTDAISRLNEGLRRPQMWSRLREIEGDVWFEDHRVFVVPDSWPEE